MDLPRIDDAVVQVLATSYGDAVAGLDTFRQLRIEMSPGLRVPFRSHRERFEAISGATVRRLGLPRRVTGALVDAIMFSFEAAPPRAGCLDVLMDLAPSFVLAVASNGDEIPVRRSLAYASEYLSCIVTSESVRAYKPSPEVFTRVLELTGSDPRGTVMLGDSVAKDCLPARGMGIRAIVLGQPEDDAGIERIASIAELPALLRKVSSTSSH